MARSTYIYIIWRPVDSIILAAFTVKHEMETWLKGRPGTAGHVRVCRFRDGQGYNDYVDVPPDYGVLV